MATTIYFRVALATTSLGDNPNDLQGNAQGWDSRLLSTARGAAATSNVVTTITGPVTGLEIGGDWSWFSEPLDQDVTISGSITSNLRAAESAMAVNAAICVRIERLDSVGAIASIVATTTDTEIATSESAENLVFTPTSTNFLKGDRIRVRVFADDAIALTMGAGTVTFWFDGPTAGASGDSFLTFTETFGFETTTPAGTQLFLTDVAGPAVGSDIEREMWTSRGDGVNTDVVNTAAGFTAPLRWTDTAGGTMVEWYSKQLQAFTLGDLVHCNLRGLVSLVFANTCFRAELAKTDADGTNAVVWGATTHPAQLVDTEAVTTVAISGDDMSVANGQRLRLRIFIDDGGLAMVSGRTATLFYDGTTGGASGDSWIQLTQSVSEFVASTDMPQVTMAPIIGY